MNGGPGRWWRPGLGVLVALLGCLALAGQVNRAVEAERHITALREHGERAPAKAYVLTSCSHSRGISCATSQVELAFTTKSGEPVLTNEREIDGTLYTPRGKRDSLLRVPTEVAYDPAAPSDAEPVAALGAGVPALLRGQWETSAVCALILVAGAGFAVRSRGG